MEKTHPTDKPIVVLKDVWKTYSMGEVKVHALKNVSLEIRHGDFVAIVGPSGSGKSTMMNLVGCLDTPTKGTVFLESRDITKMSESDLASLRGKTIGFIFQQYNLIQNMSAFENVLLPLELQEFDDYSAEKRAAELLKLVGLGDRMGSRPTQLSGGQQQRVSIARSLAANPEVVLADEPTGALDSVTGREVLETLHRLWKTEGKTIILVTHDMNLARYAQRFIELKDGEVVRVEKNRDVQKVDYRLPEKQQGIG